MKHIYPNTLEYIVINEINNHSNILQLMTPPQLDVLSKFEEDRDKKEI